jgi:hypothetical protein
MRDRKKLSKKLLQHHAHITFQNFLYGQAIFQHVSVATTTTIIREVHLHEPKHRYCKLSILLCTLSDSLRVSTNTELADYR